MGQTHDEITQNLAERLCWQVARRDDTRIARRLYRKQVVDGVYRLDEGALLDDFFHFLQELGVMAMLQETQRCGHRPGDGALRAVSLALWLENPVWD